MRLTDAEIHALACHYRDAGHVTPTLAQAKRMRDEAFDLERSIPIPVRYVKGDEPFDTLDGLRDHAKRHGELLMRDYQFHSCVWLDGYNQLRAAHDWFGHIVCNGAFSMEGEVASYHGCVRAGVFNSGTLPYLWNETVLANAHKDTFGPIGWDKVVPSGAGWLECLRAGIVKGPGDSIPGWMA